MLDHYQSMGRDPTFSEIEMSFLFPYSLHKFQTSKKDVPLQTSIETLT